MFGDGVRQTSLEREYQAWGATTEKAFSLATTNLASANGEPREGPPPMTLMTDQNYVEWDYPWLWKTCNASFLMSMLQVVVGQ